MGTNHRKCKLYIIELRDSRGDAVVEATILFPIMTMVFAALVLLSLYLPAQAVLQRATQYAATAVATEISDTWLFFDETGMSYYRHTNKDKLTNVYAGIFAASSDVQTKGEKIVASLESRSISSKAGELSVVCSLDNSFIYKEVVITASRHYPMPVDLSFIGFPKTITVTATSKAVVTNADEFIRNVDIASEFVGFISNKFGLNDVGSAISSFGGRVKSILGW
ncbi:MAG: hypothetical protein FWD44_05025 [Oscillospiraceae bacterium]|nr:hypothetical protein [Oscillospiraceae bacterium]